MGLGSNDFFFVLFNVKISLLYSLSLPPSFSLLRSAHCVDLTVLEHDI